MTWLTIRILDILDHKQAFFSLIFRPPLKYQTIWQPDTNLPFQYQTFLVFRWLHHFEKHHIFDRLLILIFPPNFRSNSTAAGRTTRPTTAASARRKCSTSSSSGRTRHPTSCTAYSAQERTSQTWGAGSAWRSTPWTNCARFMMIFSWQLPQVQIQLQISH